MSLSSVIWIGGIIVVVFVCSSFVFNKSNETNILMENHEEWRDLAFNITSFEIKGDVAILKTAGMYKGKTIGFGIEIPVKIRLSIFDEQGPEVEKGSIFSLGNKSNRFIHALSEIYGYPCHENMAKKIFYDIIALKDCDLTHYKSGEFHYATKVFFDSYREEGYYCEAFININSETMKLEFREKDSDYRENIINVLIGTK